MSQGSINSNDVLLSVVQPNGVTDEFYPKTKARLVEVDKSKNQDILMDDLQSTLNNLKSGAITKASPGTSAITSGYSNCDKVLANHAEIYATYNKLLKIIEGIAGTSYDKMKLHEILNVLVTRDQGNNITGYKPITDIVLKEVAISPDSIANPLLNDDCIPTYGGITRYLNKLANPFSKTGSLLTRSKLMINTVNAGVGGAGKAALAPDLSNVFTLNKTYNIRISLLGIPIYLAQLTTPSQAGQSLRLIEYFKLYEQSRPYYLERLYDYTKSGILVDSSGYINIDNLILFNNPDTGQPDFENSTVADQYRNELARNYHIYYDALYVSIYEG